MANYDVPENPEYSEEIRKIETSDPIHADVVNPMISQLLNNEVFLKNKMDVIATGICTTPQGTSAKTVDCPGFKLKDGARVMMTFSNGSSTDSMTINVNGTGEYHAWFPLGQTCADNDKAISKLIAAGCAYEFIFQEDGSNSKWVYCGVVSTAESIGALSKNDLSNSLGGPGIPIIQSATDSGGLMEIGKYIDFHDAGSQSDFDARLYCENGELVSTSPLRTSLKGNADSATKAIQDGNGNVIADTYAKLSNGILKGHKLENSTLDSTLMKSTIFESGATFECYGSQGINFYSNQNGKLLSNNAFQSMDVMVSDGFIAAGDIDEGCMMYIAHGACCTHVFASYDGYGVFEGDVSIVGGQVWASEFTSTGGDYAEYWEYQDSNPNGEDRAGLFVTFTGNKIRIAQKDDPLTKVGVVSACPSIVGDSDKKEWVHKYQKDVYGRDIWEDVEQEDGTVIQERVLNPAYDETQKYIKRADRPEWDAVGTHGKLVVRDDGTCEPDGFCAPADGGIATAAAEGFYVMERLDESHIRIYMR